MAGNIDLLGTDTVGRRRPPQEAEPPASARMFTFVTAQDEHRARSHAMRESWRKRKQQKQQTQSHMVPRTRPDCRPLVPKLPSTTAEQQQTSILDEVLQIPDSDSLNAMFDYLHTGTSTPMLWSRDGSSIDDHASNWAYGDDDLTNLLGIPAQALTGMNHALATVSLDPFDTFPLKLTTRHHQLLHHWLSSHAAMMFEESPRSDFNPMRDVWFPLDLSNAASFNGMLAHAAAHLAYLRGEKHSIEVLRYKSEAVSLVNRWLADELMALSDHTFAAVIRLLTFERYWGTEDLWKVHRNGLERMIEARGGMPSLQGNWRLGLVLQLISLMSKPSWFYPSNNISEISDSLAYISSSEAMGSTVDLQKLRSLWLISFIQDMRSLMVGSCRLHSEGLQRYPALYEAVSVLRNSFRRSMHDYHPGPEAMEASSQFEYDRIVCLFYIGVMVQESTSSSYRGVIASVEFVNTGLLSDFSNSEDDQLFMLDRAMRATREFWRDSISHLRAFLLEHFMSQSDDAIRAEYAVHMTEVLTSLSREARNGVEKCLLNMFSGTFDKDIYNIDKEDWTVDSLLSSIHGA